MIREAEERDINEVMSFMSPEELSRFSLAGLSARDAIKASLGPFTYCGVVQDKVACMFGIRFSEDIGEPPILWLIRGPLVQEHKIEFLRATRLFVQRAVGIWGPVESCVLNTNTLSIRWLTWLGFKSVSSIGNFIRMRKDA